MQSFEEDQGKVNEKMVAEMLSKGGRVRAVQERASTEKAKRLCDEACIPGKT